jgi:non-ribosomal peptide synthase protein (TIGR01720 family)
VHIALEAHGREDIFDEVDLSRTVGWLTSLYPALVSLETDQPGGQLLSVKEQVRRIPNRGLGYGVLRYLSPVGAARLLALPQPQVSFNYLGQLDPVLDADALLRLTTGPVGSEMDPRTPRPYLLEISGQVSGAQLTLHWAYSRTLYREATIEKLAGKFMDVLRSLIAHCLSPEAGGHSPVDFPLAKVDQSELNQALSLFDL